MPTTSKRQTWRLDQLSKTLFFHQKLHAWGLIEVAEEIESIAGENLDWEFRELGISQKAWNKIIHSGIKPIIVFAHPQVLATVQRSTSYYRMLAMVSQKSMNQVGVSTSRFENPEKYPNFTSATSIAFRLNTIVSNLIESEDRVNRREFDLWRGMAAGSQAQGSWQNAKGDRMEIIIRNDLIARLRQVDMIAKDILVDVNSRTLEIKLLDGRVLRMGAEPDIAFYKNDQIEIAIEIKGGIDDAGVLERVGAAIKSLRRAAEENPRSTTILIVPTVSMSRQAERDILSNQESVNFWFTIEEVLEDPSIADNYYRLLGL